MSSLLDMLTSQIGGNAMKHIAGTIGADEGTTSKALSAAMPLLMSALAKNAANPQGAQALHNALTKDHNGSILDDVLGFLGNPAVANGAGILKHVLGGQQTTVQQGISKATGLDASAVGQLLQIAAPLIMGALGRTTAQQGFNANTLAQFLGGQQQAMQVNPQASGVMGLVGSLLDQNNDGNVLDDVARLAGKFLGGR
jgi:hypothetical protein